MAFELVPFFAVEETQNKFLVKLSAVVVENRLPVLKKYI